MPFKSSVERMMRKTLLTYPPSSKKQIWDTLYGGSVALALAEYASARQGLTLIVTPGLLEAETLKQEFQFFSDYKEQPLFFPDWETLPYDQFSPHEDIISERLRFLKELPLRKKGVCFASVSTLLHRLLPPSFLQQTVFSLRVSQNLPMESFQAELLKAGYRATSRVIEHGEFARRGNLIDLYPMGHTLPLRIEWFDETIESLREFDKETQRTLQQIQKFEILPAHEFPMTEDAILHFRRRFREAFPKSNERNNTVYEAVTEGRIMGGLQYYLPLFFENTATFFDFLPPHTEIILIDNVLGEIARFSEEIKNRYEERSHDILRPILPPSRLFLDETLFMTGVNQYPSIKILRHPERSERAPSIGTVPHDRRSLAALGMTDEQLPKKHAFSFKTSRAPLLPLEKQKNSPLEKLVSYQKEKKGRILIVADSKGRREVLSDLSKQSGLSPSFVESWFDFLENDTPLGIVEGPIAEGFELNEQGIFVVAESALYGGLPSLKERSKAKTVDPASVIRDLAELKEGAPVVHLQFGVGRYEGLITLQHEGVMNDFLILTYAQGDKVYVPITSLHVISRYLGSEHAPLHRLGSDAWQKAKKKASEKINDTAVKLLEIYAQREAKPGFSHEINLQEYEIFKNGFPFEETVDQKSAIEKIIEDMKRPRPMDRLLCGDVGFGKTEVAMRAAFIAAQNGKQVCVLVPTTLLASQHFENFRDRFSDFPIQIELISRFRSAKETKDVLSRVEKGTVDIIIGTHKLFSSTIAFKELGLLIIDEEHRFGVQQKERIKALKLDVDILSLTATPIPRTLSMAMSGIRDISIMATPPLKRLAVKTFWQEKSNTIIREALLREILRGGQVFFVHNDIDTIEKTRDTLQNLVKEARIMTAHGQMRERELEKIMSDFYHQRFNVLVCTTIIETGIDIPTANTILIDDADEFGLAQLHQLRGRVGRSHHQAYAYLLTREEKKLTKDAKKRLEAIISLEDLGAGFILSTHDLEIRGAGELLGEKQSGNIEEIGFSLYMEMLDKAVNALKAHEKPDFEKSLGQNTEIDLNISAILPEDYIGDIHERLILYKRIAEIESESALFDLKAELTDRFGIFKPSVENLFSVTLIKIKAQKLGIKKISVRKGYGSMEFFENPLINTLKLLELIQKESQYYQLKGGDKLLFRLKDDQQVIPEIHTLIEKLTPCKCSR